MKFLYYLALIALFSAPLSGDAKPITNSTEIWSAWSSNAELHVYPDTFSKAGIELSVDGQMLKDGSRIGFSDLNLGALEFHAPAGNFEAFLDGRMVLGAKFQLAHDGNMVSIDRLIVQRNPKDKHGLMLLDGNGMPLFSASHIHIYTQPDRSRLVMERMDVRMSQELADSLGVSEWGGLFVGELALDALLHIPAGAKTDGRGSPACDSRPQWSTEGFDVDVELIAMGQVADRGTVVEDGKTFEILTPSARLKNDSSLSAADVPWYTKFTGPFPPHNNDQHPYLIWNLYRISDGRLEQVGVSGMKYAFLTINVSCTINCGNGGIPQADGHILWPGCEDVYGVGNNDSGRDLGPRGEINPRTGIFESTGSFFDPDGNGVQEPGDGSFAPGENRMKVWVEDLQTPDAQYLFESWYVIRDDINIYNGMGYHPLTPNNVSGNNWQYGLGSFAQGRALDQWVAPGGTPASGAMNVLFDQDEIGHLQVLVRAEETLEGRWRYTYVVKNYDVDHGIESFAINANTTVDNWHFHDPDQDDTNEWLNQDSGTQLIFSAPIVDDSVVNPLTWGQAYTFGFESDAPPIAATVDIAFGPTARPSSTTLDLLAPDIVEAIFFDGFEIQQ